MNAASHSTLWVVVAAVAGFWSRPVSAALESGVYQTLPGVQVQEWGDRVPNRSRLVPFAATITVNLESTPPKLSAFLPGAVLEGGAPFALSLHSSSVFQSSNQWIQFRGDYLREVYPAGTQYYFTWRLSIPTNGITTGLVWDGDIGWGGGHAWYVTITNLTLVPRSQLNLEQTGAASFQLSWSTNFADQVLEAATAFPASAWTGVTNAVSVVGQRMVVSVAPAEAQKFYRLRQP